MLQNSINNRSPCLTALAFSDLQTYHKNKIRRYFETIRSDLNSINIEIDELWYLGDAILGDRLRENIEIANLQKDLITELGCPLRYVMGNHDLDYVKKFDEFQSPFYDLVSDTKGWKTTKEPEDFYFYHELNNWKLVFLSDHADRDGNWSVTHGQINGDQQYYPHSIDSYRSVRDEISKSDKYSILLGHNAFPGGNRPAKIQTRLFPLPENVKTYFYGHAHIGERQWVGKNVYRTISYIDDHQIPQIDIASIEDYRGDTIRSTIIELYEDGSVISHIRDNKKGEFLETYVNH